MGEPQLITLDAESFDRWPCCGIKNPDHPGRREKRRWLLAYAATGLTAKVLIAPEGDAAGYIEYVPGEYAWRAIMAPDYLVIHCVWVFAKRHQGKGYGRMLVADAIASAYAAGKSGVTVVARKGPWAADPRLFSALGFTACDEAPPDYQLMVKMLKPDAAPTAFLRNPVRPQRGLTILKSAQCPYTAKFAADIAQAATEFHLKTRITDAKSEREAQAAPTPGAVFTVVRDGRVIADHQISAARFRNIMRAG